MVDREKVLKGLECCFGSIGKACPMECPYRVECLMQDDEYNMYSVMHDALKLLKHNEQTIESLQSTINKLTKALAEKPEIVRCKDCIHWDDDDCEIGNNPQMFADDWYCPCGEVKQGES